MQDFYSEITDTNCITVIVMDFVLAESFVDVMTALAALFLVVSKDKLVLLPTSLDNIGVVQSFKDLCRHAFGASKWDGTKQRGCITWSNWCS